MTLILSGTAGLSDVDGSAATPAIRGTDTNTGIFFPAADTIAFAEGGVEAMRLDSAGNMGLGVTPSTYSIGKVVEVGFAGNSFWGYAANTNLVTQNVNLASGALRYSSTNPASFYQQSSGVHTWGVAPSGTAGNAITFTQAMTLDASGNFMVGTTTPLQTASNRGNITVNGSASSILNMGVNGSVAAYIFASSTSATYEVAGTNTISASGANVIALNTNGSERARIDSSGNLWVGTNNGSAFVGGSPVGSFVNVASTAGTNSTAFVHTNSSNPYGPFIYFNSAAPNNTSNYFLNCNDNVNTKAIIYSSGTFGSRTSTYGGISDIKVKQDIVDASSQWGDIKALRFRKYRFKDDPTGPLQLGLISQEAELVSPGLVFETPDTINVEVPVLDENGDAVFNEDGTPQTTTERQETGEVTKSVKYSILYMKAVVALQEAMNRIEQLEADVAALKGTQP